MKFKSLFLKKEKGQVMLVILVVTTLTMLLLVGMATRINTGRENIRRSSEFDRAFASSENALNDIISTVYTSNCTPTNLTTTEFNKIEGCNLDQILADERADVFAKSNETDAPITVLSPLSLSFGDPNNDIGVELSGVKIKCANGSPAIRLLVSIVYFDQNEYKVLKGNSDCASVNNNLNDKGNVFFYNSAAEKILNYQSSPQTLIQNVKLIRVRLLDNSPETRISITGIHCDPDGTCRDEGRTGSYEFMVVGLGGLGSDNIVKFEVVKGSSDNDINPLFDFVYFGEDI